MLTAPGTSVRAVVDSAFAQTGEQPTIASETTYTMTAVAMVRAGLGVAILPESARELRAEPELVTNVIKHPSFVRPIALIKKRGRTPPPVTEPCIALLRDALDDAARHR
nr:LysR substrate-binding domain-containing protein [Paraburkholderia phytofirmans]